MQSDTGRRSHSAVGAHAPRARWLSRCLNLRQAFPPAASPGKPPSCKPTVCATAVAANAARLSAGFHSRIWMDGPEARRAAPSSGAGVSSPATASSQTTTTALKGLMMKKTPQHFFTPCLKSFPLNRLQDVSKLSLGSDQGAMNVRAYTLCEVPEIHIGGFQGATRSRKPVAAPSAVRGVDLYSVLPVTHGISLKNDTNSRFCNPPKGASLLGWRANGRISQKHETYCAQSSFGGAA